jgi:hypothetical protein
VRELVFARRFLCDLVEFEAGQSPSDVQMLEGTLASIGADPALPRRVPSFYDPQAPSYLYRRGQVLVHYRVTDDRIEFLNLFFARV